MSSIQTFRLDGSFFLTFPYKIWGEQIAGMALPGVSQFSTHAEKPLRIPAHPWKKQSHRCVLDLFDEAVPSCCLLSGGRAGKMQTASHRNGSRGGTLHLVDILPRSSHLAACTSWNASPATPQGKQGHDLWFPLSKQLWKPTLHAFCAPELLPEKNEQVANWFNPLCEHCFSLWITAEHPCDQEPLQVFFSLILLLQLWEKQFSSTFLLPKAMSTRCTPTL